jgi:hypothetical protein
MAKNPCLHEKQKHIDVRYHFIRECVLRKKISVHFIGTKLMIADIMTKPVTTATFRLLGPALVGTTDLYQHVRPFVQLAHLKAEELDSEQHTPEGLETVA